MCPVPPSISQFLYIVSHISLPCPAYPKSFILSTITMGRGNFNQRNNGHKLPAQAPAGGKSCHICKKQGHVAVNCHFNKSQSNNRQGNHNGNNGNHQNNNGNGNGNGQRGGQFQNQNGRGKFQNQNGGGKQERNHNQNQKDKGERSRKPPSRPCKNCNTMGHYDNECPGQDFSSNPQQNFQMNFTPAQLLELRQISPQCPWLSQQMGQKPTAQLPATQSQAFFNEDDECEIQDYSYPAQVPQVSHPFQDPRNWRVDLDNDAIMEDAPPLPRQEYAPINPDNYVSISQYQIRHYIQQQMREQMMNTRPYMPFQPHLNWMHYR